ncbi:MAG: GIY-YIG nuclease family protein, partial [Spirochaetales bacterium]|nr:GIY-YIG nuclease family protein [Spirochaetales bacterium]
MSGWVYIVRCADGTLYTGATTNLQARIETHNAGKGAKYTRGRLPVTLV